MIILMYVRSLCFGFIIVKPTSVWCCLARFFFVVFCCTNEVCKKEWRNYLYNIIFYTFFDLIISWFLQKSLHRLCGKMTIHVTTCVHGERHPFLINSNDCICSLMLSHVSNIANKCTTICYYCLYFCSIVYTVKRVLPNERPLYLNDSSVMSIVAITVVLNFIT